jgi:hypothetical protein
MSAIPHLSGAHAAADYLLPEGMRTYPIRIHCGCGSRTWNLHATAEAIAFLRRAGADPDMIFHSWCCRGTCKQVVKITVRQLLEAAKRAA